MIILFQGDSITDANRDYQTPDTGDGYVSMIQQKLQNHTIINKGISGNRTIELLERWDQDTINLKPDILSILVGINEVWHHFRFNKKITIDLYKESYIKLIKDTQKALPNVQILLIEPFVLKVGYYEPIWDTLLDDIKKVVKDLALTFNLPFIPMQSIFNRYLSQYEPALICPDGVHPSELGHQIMAEHIHLFIESIIKNHAS